MVRFFQENLLFFGAPDGRGAGGAGGACSRGEKPRAWARGKVLREGQEGFGGKVGRGDWGPGVARRWEVLRVRGAFGRGGAGGPGENQGEGGGKKAFGGGRGNGGPGTRVWGRGAWNLPPGGETGGDRPVGLCFSFCFW